MAQFWAPQLRAPKGPRGVQKPLQLRETLEAVSEKHPHMSGMQQLPPPDPQSAPEPSLGVQLFEFA
jgi:hypothetical protein